MLLILLGLHPSGVWRSSKQRVSCRLLESTALFPGHLCQRRSDSKRRWLSIAKEGWETGEDADGVCFCARTERLRLCLVELFGTRFHFHFFHGYLVNVSAVMSKKGCRLRLCCSIGLFCCFIFLGGMLLFCNGLRFVSLFWKWTLHTALLVYYY